MDRKHMNGLRLNKETLKSLSGGDRYIKRSPGGDRDFKRIPDGDLVRRNEDAVNLRGSNGILCTASGGSCFC